MMLWFPDNNLGQWGTHAQQHSGTSKHISIIRINAVKTPYLPYTISCFFSQSSIHILHRLRNIWQFLPFIPSN